MTPRANRRDQLLHQRTPDHRDLGVGIALEGVEGERDTDC